MLELNSIAVDKELANNGVWAEYMGGEFLLARKGPKYQARLVELYNENLSVIKSGTPEGEAKSLDVFRQVFAETQLLDWKGITRDGVVIPYTPEEGFKLLADERLYELASFLEGFANNHSNYQVAVEAEVANDVKNTADS